MATMNSQKKAGTSRGWWRFFAAVVALGGGIVGLGFYLPLSRANAALNQSYLDSQRSGNDAVRELNSKSVELVNAVRERDELRSAKAEVDKSTEQSLARSSALIESMPTIVQNAIKNRRVKITPDKDALIVDVFDATLLSVSNNGLTKAGSSVLCPLLAKAQQSPDAAIVVHTYVAPDLPAPGSESRWASPSRLGAGVADGLVARCNTPPGVLSVTSTPGAGNAPALRLEISLSKH
jgi:hypothetical protein